MTAFYNEIDPYAAQWLRNLIAAGHIAPGVVDERSIVEIKPEELCGYTQCHFFAGVGVWSFALRLAGWPDDRPVWTGSCPCQPFSAAGAGAGFADERHLWPTFHHLIAECKPAIVVGEQVASKAVDDWIDLVHADLEALGYAFGSVPFPSAGVGAPHIRDRNYWVANANHARLEGRRIPSKRAAELAARSGGMAGGMARADGRDASAERQQRGGEQRQQPKDSGFVGLAYDNQHGRAAHAGAELYDAEHNAEPRSSICGLADTRGERWIGRQGISAGSVDGRTDARRIEGDHGFVGVGEAGVSRVDGPGPTNGFWRDADWLGCTDGKWRPVEPGTFPLAHAATSRVGRLRAYGNAINAEAARVWVETVMECLP